MKKILIFIFVFAFLISPILAQEISLDFPSEAGIQEEFEIKMFLIEFDPGIYDVKIDILEGGNRIAKIYDGTSWASTYYYVSESISSDSQETFKLRIEEEFEKGEVIIKIRDSGGKIYTFEGYEISFSEVEIEEEIIEEEIKEESQEEPKEDEKDEVLEGGMINFEEKEDSQKTEKIMLNSEGEEFLSKDLNKENNSAYYLVSFCLLLALLILLKFAGKKRRKNEFGK